MTKVCSKCEIEKSIEEFGLRKDRAPGTRNSHCRACGRTSSKNWKAKNPERTRELSRNSAAAFYERFPERVQATSRRRYQKHTEKIKSEIYARHQNRLLIDPAYRVCKNLRERIRSVMLGLNKSGPTAKLIGCPWDYLKLWLQAQFKLGMTWENYGDWHIDHILPCASFNLIDPTEQRRCFHYTNLQPLWAEENLQKSSKIL